MKNIGIIFAMEEEINTFFKYTKIKKNMSFMIL